MQLTLRGQVDADVAIEVHGAMEAAVTELTQAEGAAAAQLPALLVVAFLRGHESIRQGLPAAASYGMLTGGKASITSSKVLSPSCSWHVVHREC